MKLLFNNFLLITCASSPPLAKLEQNVRAIVAENKELLKLNKHYREKLECGKPGEAVCSPDVPDQPLVYKLGCSGDGSDEIVVGDFSVGKDATFEVTVNIGEANNLLVGLFLNDELLTYAVLDDTSVVSASISWAGELTTDDTLSVKQMMDYHEDIEGSLDAKQFSRIACDHFVFFVNELTVNSY